MAQHQLNDPNWPPADFPEADRREALAAAARAHNHFVAVSQEGMTVERGSAANAGCFSPQLLPFNGIGPDYESQKPQ